MKNEAIISLTCNKLELESEIYTQFDCNASKTMQYRNELKELSDHDFCLDQIPR